MKQVVGGIGIILLIIFAAVAGGCTRDAAVADSSTPAASVSIRETLVLPAGSRVLAVLDTQVSTDANSTGDPFVARTVEPVVVDGTTVLPANSRIDGVLRDVQASGRIKERARMTLVFLEIEDSAGSTHRLTALPLTISNGHDVKLDQGAKMYLELTGPTTFVVATRR